MKKKLSIPGFRYKRIWGLFQRRGIIIPMLKDVYKGQYKMSIINTIVFILALVYILSPIDLIPDFYVVVGWFDDLIVFSFLSNFLNKELDKYLIQSKHTLSIDSIK